MKGNKGHRPGNDIQTHTQEGIADKTATKAKAPANKHVQGSTASSVGRFGGLNCHDGEGVADKSTRRK